MRKLLAAVWSVARHRRPFVPHMAPTAIAELDMPNRAPRCVIINPGASAQRVRDVDVQAAIYGDTLEHSHGCGRFGTHR